MSPPRIAIIGGGPAGLTLARLLYVAKVNVEVSVYESDASPTARTEQGGTLDLHTNTGLAALRKCDIWESFLRYARYEGSEMILADKNHTELVHVRGGERKGPFDRPEIDRERLKEILLESLPEEYMRWDRRLKEVTEGGMLSFEGRKETEGPFDLIVGADGAWSKVRMRLSDVKPSYAGVSGYEMEIKEPPKTCLHVDKMVGRGSFIGSSDQKMLNGQRMGNNSIKVRSWYTCSEGEAKRILKEDGKEKTLEKILQRYRGWAPEMTELLKQADLDSIRVWELYELPVGFTWTHKKGFTLIGDAASLATPFSGEGVNKAMKDSLELAEFIQRSQLSEDNLTLDEAVLRYEVAMFPRAHRLQRTTMMNKENTFGPAGPIGMITGMLRTVASDSNSIFVRIIGTAPFVALVFSYFWIRQQIGLAVRKFWRKT